MKEIYIKVIGVVVAVMIILTAFTFIRQNEISGLLQERAFSARILSDATTGTNPITINFESLLFNEKGKVKYFWDFGDGNKSEEANPSNLYKKGGDYVCKLVVTDEKGNKAEDTLDIKIDYNKPPVVILTVNKNSYTRKYIPIISSPLLYMGTVCKILKPIEENNPYAFGEGTIVCTAQVSDPEGDDIVSYEWVHSEEGQTTMLGTVVYPVHNLLGNESVRIPEIYTFPTGWHTVTLTVTDSLGNQANASIAFQVQQSEKVSLRTSTIRNIQGMLTTWLTIFKPFLGPTVAALFLLMWKYDNFEAIKIVTLFLLQFAFQLDMGDAVMIEFKAFLDNHPTASKIVDKFLIKMQQKLNNPDIEILRESLGLTNNRPKIFNPFPENGSKNIPLDAPYVAINVSDLEGDHFNVTISGEYVNNVTYTDATNGTFIATLITPLPDREEISWNVEVVDPQGKIVTGEYKFTTFVAI